MNANIRRVSEFEPIKRVGPPKVELVEGSLTDIRFRQNVGGRLPTGWIDAFVDALNASVGAPVLIPETTDAGSVVVVGQFAHQGLETAVAAVDAAIEGANTEYLENGLEQDRWWLARRDELEQGLTERLKALTPPRNLIVDKQRIVDKRR